MSVIVQCTNCGKQLKLKEPAPGKKVRCPECKAPFEIPAAGAAPRTQRKPANDFADDEEDFDDAPPARTQAGKKAAPGKKGKGASNSKSKTPLFIGVGVLGLALAGGLAYMLMPSGDANVDGNAAADAPAEAEMPGDAAAGGEMPEGVPAAAAPPAAGNPLLKWLPAASELIVQLDVARLLGGPMGDLLKNPLVTQPLEDFRKKTGFGPEDIQSVTLGMAGISDAVSSGQQPTPEKLPFIAVIRAKKSIDATQLKTSIPNSETVSSGSQSYLRVPENPPIAIWLADPTTAIFGAEENVKLAMAAGSAQASMDVSLMDGTSTIQAAFSPKNPDAIFKNAAANLPPQMPPVQAALAKSFLNHAQAMGFGLDLTKDLGISTATRCRDSAGAQELATALNAAQAENKAQADAQKGQAAMMNPLMNLGKAMSDSFKVEQTGDKCSVSMNAPGGGQQLAVFAPMMLAPAIMQARAAAQQVQSKNNLKQISLAMFNFHEVYTRFPNSAGQSETGEKWLSWRVHLLPFLGQQELYKKFALEEPWDSATNRPLADQMPEVFASTKVKLDPGKTLYQLPIGPGTVFDGTKGKSMKDIADGTSNTILVVEVSPDRAVVWTQPEDFAYNPDTPLAGLGGVEPNGFQAALADGSVKLISSTISPEVLKAMFTCAGGEPVNP